MRTVPPGAEGWLEGGVEYSPGQYISQGPPERNGASWGQGVVFGDLFLGIGVCVCGSQEV